MACVDFIKIFKDLLPKGRAFRLPYGSTIYQWFLGISDEPQRLCQFINDTRDAGIPGFIPDDALGDWEDDLALRRNSALSNKERNDRVVGKVSATGGGGPDYIQGVIQKAGFPLYVYENNPVDNPDVRAYIATMGGVTMGATTMGAYTDRIDPRSVPGILVAGPDVYELVKNYSATMGGVNMGETSMGAYVSNETIAMEYEIPPLPDRYIFVWFLSGAGGLGDFVDIEASRWDDLKRTILEIKQAHTWVIVQVNLV